MADGAADGPLEVAVDLPVAVVSVLGESVASCRSVQPAAAAPPSTATVERSTVRRFKAMSRSY
jgi:hypothetical protein